MINHAINGIKQVKVALESSVSGLLPLLTDKNFPLDERWELFKEMSQFLPIPSYGSDYAAEELGLISSEHDFGTERNETILFVDRYDTFLDMKYEYDLHDERGAAFQDQAKLDEWRERILAAGEAGFIYD